MTFVAVGHKRHFWPTDLRRQRPLARRRQPRLTRELLYQPSHAVEVQREALGRLQDRVSLLVDQLHCRHLELTRDPSSCHMDSFWPALSRPPGCPPFVGKPKIPGYLVSVTELQRRITEVRSVKTGALNRRTNFVEIWSETCSNARGARGGRSRRYGKTFPACAGIRPTAGSSGLRWGRVKRLGRIADRAADGPAGRDDPGLSKGLRCLGPCPYFTKDRRDLARPVLRA